MTKNESMLLLALAMEVFLEGKTPQEFRESKDYDKSFDKITNLIESVVFETAERPLTDDRR